MTIQINDTNQFLTLIPLSDEFVFAKFCINYNIEIHNRWVNYHYKLYTLLQCPYRTGLMLIILVQLSSISIRNIQ